MERLSSRRSDGVSDSDEEQVAGAMTLRPMSADLRDSQIIKIGVHEP